MSFFNYTPPPPPAAEEKPPYQKIDPHLVIIDGSNLIKEIADNPEIPDAKIDVGNWNINMWQPLNYNPETGVINK